MNNFLNLQPVLDKEEQERIRAIEAQPYNEVYQDKLEGEIYDWAKAKRKQQGMDALSFNPEKVDTYSNLSVNKFREDSPISVATILWKTPWFVSIEDRKKSVIKWALDIAVPKVLRPSLKAWAWELAQKSAAVLDVPLQQLAKAWVATTTLSWGAYYNTKELVDSIKEDRDFDFIKAGEKTEDLLKTAEWFFGTCLLYTSPSPRD